MKRFEMTEDTIKKVEKTAIAVAAGVGTMNVVTGTLYGLADGVALGLTGERLKGGAALIAGVPAIAAGAVAGTAAMKYADLGMTIIDSKTSEISGDDFEDFEEVGETSQV